MKAGQTPRVPVRDDVRRTLIWTPDASRGLAALGNAEDAFGQTWHLPCCDERMTYREFVTLACEAFGQPVSYKVVSKLGLEVAGIFSKQARELRELLPRYQHDNLFDSTKFKHRFPTFDVDDVSARHRADSKRSGELIMTATRKPPWKKPKPPGAGASTPLTERQRDAARKRAEEAGRRYPNLVDNMWAARQPK